MANMSDFLKAFGSFSFLVKNVITGKEWIHYADSNTIVLIAKRNVIRCLGNDNISGRYLRRMRFTDQGTDPLNPGQLISPKETWEEMGRPDVPEGPSYINFGGNDYKEISNYTFTETTDSIMKVTCTVIIDTSEANGPGGAGQAFSQAGLFTSNENLPGPSSEKTAGLFAIKNFLPITKTSDLLFTFNWTIGM